MERDARPAPGADRAVRDAGDVVAAIAHAREQDLEIAVRGGGHSMPGYSTGDDGLVIDLRLMNQMPVDPAPGARPSRRRTARRRGPATQRHGLVVPAGVIRTPASAGLTLGGGVGRLMRRFGLTIDSLLAAELVTADGRSPAAADQHPDLFWASAAAAATSASSPSSSSRCMSSASCRAPDVPRDGRRAPGARPGPAGHRRGRTARAAVDEFRPQGSAAALDAARSGRPPGKRVGHRVVRRPAPA